MRQYRGAVLSALLALAAASVLLLVSNSPASAAATDRVLITGDSITQGSSGDYTWRYRLWDKLQSTEAGQVEFVGTRSDLYDNVNDGFGSQHYAVNFAGEKHAAKWGSTYWQELANIQNQVTSSGANTLVVMLGSNDLSYATSPAATIDNVRTYIQTARAAMPGIDVVVGEVVNKYDPWTGVYSLESEGADYASRLRTLATQLNTASERVVVASTRTGWDARDHTWDGTHPNPTGEALIAQRMSQALASIGIGTSTPDISGAKAWNVAAPALTGLTPGSEQATLSWNRTSTGATGMYIHVRNVDTDEPWNPLPYAVGGSGWTAELLAAGGTYQFRNAPAKGWNTGLPGPASTVTVGGPQPGAIASLAARSTGESIYGGMRITADWSASANSTGYLLSSRMGGTTGAEAWSNLPYPVSDTRTWTWEPLYPGRWHEMRVRGVRGFLNSAWKVSNKERTLGTPGEQVHVGLGDSYSAGVGAEEDHVYFDGSCYRSGEAWPYKILQYSVTNRENWACTGAVVAGIANQRTYLRQKFAKHPGRPAVVTMTVGGNDVGFSDELKRCITSDCTSRESAMNTKIDAMRPTLAAVYRQIVADAPYADIYVGGYPGLLEPAGTSLAAACIPITRPEREMVQRLARRLNNVISYAANDAGGGVFAIGNGLVTRFAGHNACVGGIHEWIHAQVAAYLVESFHPNRSGQTAYAIEFNNLISQLSAGG